MKLKKKQKFQAQIFNVGPNLTPDEAMKRAKKRATRDFRGASYDRVTGRIVLVCIALLGCKELPPPRCTPLDQRAFLLACEQALQLECDKSGVCISAAEFCPPALREVCPKPMCGEGVK